MRLRPKSRRASTLLESRPLAPRRRETRGPRCRVHPELHPPRETDRLPGRPTATVLPDPPWATVRTGRTVQAARHRASVLADTAIPDIHPPTGHTVPGPVPGRASLQALVQATKAVLPGPAIKARAVVIKAALPARATKARAADMEALEADVPAAIKARPRAAADTGLLVRADTKAATAASTRAATKAKAATADLRAPLVLADTRAATGPSVPAAMGRNDPAAMVAGPGGRAAMADQAVEARAAEVDQAQARLPSPARLRLASRFPGASLRSTSARTRPRRPSSSRRRPKPERWRSPRRSTSWRISPSRSSPRR